MLVAAGGEERWRYCQRPISIARANEFKRQVWWCRCFVSLSIAVVCCKYDAVNGLLTAFYERLSQSYIFRHDSFEPILSASCFMANILMYWIIDSFVPHLHVYRINGSTAMTAYQKGHRWRDELLWYLVPLLFFDALYPRRLIPVEPPLLTRLLLDIFSAVAVYDILFWIGHVASHFSPIIWKNVHAKHHEQPIQRACETVRLTFLDGAADVFYSITAINLLGLHPLSRALYDIVIICLLCELHAGYDFPFHLHNLVPGSWLGGAPRHDFHHRSGKKVYFQKFFTFLDAIFGFVEEESGHKWWYKNYEIKRSSTTRYCGVEVK